MVAWPLRVVACAAVALAVLVCSAVAQAPVRVASKIDTEGALLGNMILAALRADGVAVVDKLQLGPTNILRRAIVAGEIDIYPEYTGNGAVFYALNSDPVWADAAAGYEKIRSLDWAKHGLVWLRPAPADNSWVIALRRDVASAHQLATMEDVARWVRQGGKLTLAASAEFVESPAALPAFEKAYDFRLSPDQLIVLAGGDTAVTERAAGEGISGVDAAMAYGTDGALAALGLVVMADPRSAQIVYAPAPVVRGTVLEAHPQIAARLTTIFRSLDNPMLRRLNARVAVEGESAAEVALDYLRTKGFLD